MKLKTTIISIYLFISFADSTLRYFLGVVKNPVFLQKKFGILNFLFVYLCLIFSH